jgi:hypothetical protein
MIPYEILKELVINGVKFKYESYDHKKALKEYEQTQSTSASTSNWACANLAWGIPDNIKKNHAVWRVGRLWEVYFNKKGEMYRFKIGCHYAKNFYLDDFGITVKPIIFKSDDKYDLIGQDLAVEDKI